MRLIRRRWEEEPEAEIRVSERKKPSELAEEKKEYLEKKREREFRRKERGAAEQALEKVLGSGLEGMKVEDLKQQLKDEGYSEGVVKAAVERLQDEDQVRMEEDRILSRGASRAEGEAYPDDDVHDFFVEKVRKGAAVVKVDGK